MRAYSIVGLVIKLCVVESIQTYIVTYAQICPIIKGATKQNKRLLCTSQTSPKHLILKTFFVIVL